MAMAGTRKAMPQKLDVARMISTAFLARKSAIQPGNVVAVAVMAQVIWGMACSLQTHAARGDMLQSWRLAQCGGRAATLRAKVLLRESGQRWKTARQRRRK